MSRSNVKVKNQNVVLIQTEDMLDILEYLSGIMETSYHAYPGKVRDLYDKILQDNPWLKAKL